MDVGAGDENLWRAREDVYVCSGKAIEFLVLMTLSSRARRYSESTPPEGKRYDKMQFAITTDRCELIYISRCAVMCPAYNSNEGGRSREFVVREEEEEMAQLARWDVFRRRERRTRSKRQKRSDIPSRDV